MKILFVGEIVGEAGRKVVKEFLPSLIEEISPDLVLANAENISGGRGVLRNNLEEMQYAGVDFFTSGDHVFHFKETEDYIDHLPLIRPANYSEEVPGKGFEVVSTALGKKILIINLMGRTSFGGEGCLLKDPFTTADDIIDNHKDQKIDEIIVDFHAEATSEKTALAFYLDGRVSAVVGSHTHVPTCDHRVLPDGTMFVTDVGMCGSLDSVIGVKKDIVIKMFLTGMKQKFEWESAGTKAFRSVLLDTESSMIDRFDKFI